MLSRIAESLFWLARYIERAEDTARILDVTYHTLLEQSQQHYRLRWDPLVVMAGEEERFRQLYEEATARAMFSNSWPSTQDNPSSIMQCIEKSPRKCPHHPRSYFARNVGRPQRPVLHAGIVFIRKMKSPQARTAFATKVIFGSHRFHGVTDATLPHDEGWDFLRIGWALERAEMTARLVDVQYHTLLDERPPWNLCRTIISGWPC